MLVVFLCLWLSSICSSSVLCSVYIYKLLCTFNIINLKYHAYCTRNFIKLWSRWPTIAVMPPTKQKAWRWKAMPEGTLVSLSTSSNQTMFPFLICILLVRETGKSCWPRQSCCVFLVLWQWCRKPSVGTSSGRCCRVTVLACWVFYLATTILMYVLLLSRNLLHGALGHDLHAMVVWDMFLCLCENMRCW